MAAVGLSQDEAEQAIAGYPGRLAIAAVNSPQSVTLSGDEEALTALGRVLTQRQVFFRVLALNYPFHCRHMDPIEDELQQSLQSLTPRAASIPFVSSVTGTELGGEHLGPEYWWKNIRHPVLFAQAIRALAARGVDVWLEIGPNPVLASYITETLANEGSCKVLPSLRRLQDDRTMLLGTLGTLHTMGLNVCWQRLFPGPTPHLDLPRNAWQYERFWNETTRSSGKMRGIAVHPLLGGRLEVARPTWENELDGRLQPYLLDHQLQGAVVFPAAGYVELGLAVARELLGDVACVLEDLDIRKALTLAKGPTVLQTASTVNEHTFEIFSRPTDEQLWVSHATFQLQRIPTAPPSSVDLQALRQRVHRPKCRATHYRDTARCGLQYGPTFQGIRDLRAGGNEALGEIQLPADLGDYRCHPALLDACFQVLFAALPSPGQENRPAFLPVRIERFRFHGGCPSRVYCHVRIRKQSPHLLLADGVVCDTSGRVVAEIVGFHLHPVELHGRVSDEGLYAFRWEAASRPSTALPAPQQLDKQVSGQMELLFEQRGRKHFYNSFRPLVDQLCAAYVWQMLGELGVTLREGIHFSRSDLLAPAPHAPHFPDYLDLLLEMLRQEGVVHRLGEKEWAVTAIPHWPKEEVLWRRLVQTHPAYLAELQILQQVGPQLSRVLKGEVEALQLVFPEQSDAAEHLYETGPYFRFYNDLAQKVVASLVESLAPGCVLHILEIGAGTGGTTSSLLPILPAAHTRYTFTDVSREFLNKAQERFQRYPFVDYRTLNLEGDALEQRFPAHSYDLILCSNALHATRDLRESLARLRQLLASNGLVLVMEVLLNPCRFIDLVFGTLPGWWQFKDAHDRATHPLVSEENWLERFHEAGFLETAALSERTLVPKSEQVLLLARGPRLEPAAEVSNPETPGKWLVLVDAGEAALGLVRALRDQGRAVVTVSAGNAYVHQEADTVTLRPWVAEDYERLFADLRAVNVTTIVHCWSLDAVQERKDGFDTPPQVVE